MRSVTVLSVALFGVDRFDPRLDVLAVAIYNLAELAGMERPVITSSTQAVPGTVEAFIDEEDP